MVIALPHGTLDLDAGTFTPTGGAADSLTETERKLLRHMATRPGVPVSREDLQREVWGYRDGILSRTVFTTVGRVRAKIELNPSDPRHLLTVPGVGYALVVGGLTPAGPERAQLPSPVGLVGRAADLVGVEQLFAGGARLVTLLGPGGIGKTALATELARRRAGLVGFCTLEPVEADSGVPVAMAASLGLTLSGGRDPWGELAGRVGGEAALCVLDNAEHLPGLAPALPGLLGACPGLCCLVTTRVRLGLRDEHAWTLSPLDPAAALDLAVARARRARPGWEPTAADLAALGELCGRLGGSPLAIELACAWLRLLEPTEILAELDRSTAVLHALDRDVPARHRSVDATLDASWGLLDPAAARVIERLSTFCGAFGRAAAVEVADADLLTLGQLVDASMVVRSPRGFDVHPLVRQHARQRLARDPARLAEAGLRHARHVLARLVRAIDGLEAGELAAAACLATLGPLHADIVAAWSNRARAGDRDALAAAAPALYRYLDLANRHVELFEVLALAVSAVGDPRLDGLALAMLLLGAGAGSPAIRGVPLDAALLVDVPEPLRTTAHVHGAIAALYSAGPTAAVPWAERAVELAQASGRPFLVGFSRAVRGSTRLRVGALDGARADLTEAMSASREDRARGRVAVHLGELELAAGRWSEGRAALEAAIAACRLTEDRSFTLLALGRLAQAMAQLGASPVEVCIEAIDEGVSSRVPRVWWSTALVELAEHQLAEGHAGDSLFLASAAAAAPNMQRPGVIEALVARASALAPADEAARGREASDAQVLARARSATKNPADRTTSDRRDLGREPAPDDAAKAGDHPVAAPAGQPRRHEEHPQAPERHHPEEDHHDADPQRVRPAKAPCRKNHHGADRHGGEQRAGGDHEEGERLPCGEPDLRPTPDNQRRQ